MEAKLIVVGGKASKREVSLKLPTTIGRSRQADLTVAHPMVSRQHCELYEEDGVLKLRDLGSLNGTFIDGQRISEACLRPDAQFTVGPLTFCAKYEYAGDVNAIPLPRTADGQQLDMAATDEAPDFQVADEQPGIEATPLAGEIAGIAPADGELPDFAAWADSEAQPAGLVEAAPVAQPESAEPEFEEEEEPEPTPPPPLPSIEQEAPQSEQPAAEPSTEEPPAQQVSEEQSVEVQIEGIDERAPQPVPDHPGQDEPEQDESEPPAGFDSLEETPLVPPIEETVQIEVALPAEQAEPEPDGQTDGESAEEVEPELEHSENEEEEGGGKGKKKRWWPFGKRKSKQKDAESEEEPDEEPKADRPEAKQEPVVLPGADSAKPAPESDDLSDFFKGLQ